MNKTRKNVVICVIIILIIVLPIVYITIDNSDIKAILLGIISSIIASAIFSILSAFVFDNKIEQAEALKQLISSIDSKLTKGVLELKDRAEFESDFWIKFAKTANKEWTISGRTLNRWLGGSIKEDFKKNIIRILKDKGEINLVIYKKLDGEEEKEKKLLHDFLKKEIFPACVKKEKSRYIMKKDVKLAIYEVDSLPYLYNANDAEIIVAPYFTYAENSNNLMFVLKRSCKYGEEYSRDFKHILLSADKNNWLDNYLEERNK